VIMTYVGLLENGSTFDRGQSEFVLGEKKVSCAFLVAELSIAPPLV
jgi:hypothetical protein